MHTVSAALTHLDSLLSEVAPNKEISPCWLVLSAVCGSPGKLQGPRALSCVVGIWEASTLAFFPEASMKEGFRTLILPKLRKARVRGNSFSICCVPGTC